MKFIETPQGSEHWYRSDGSSQHGADLRIARKENLFPSVTSILQTKAKPGLDAWKRQEAILAALTLPRLDGESEDDFANRVAVDMDSHAKGAAIIGTSLHNFAEKYINGENPDLVPTYETVCSLVKCWIDENLLDGIAEKSMVSTEYGYAGRRDWSGNFSTGNYGILDFKSQNVKPGKKPVFYPEHCYQLAAYAEGKPMELVNLIISTNPDNPIVAEKRWTAEEAENGWQIFKALLKVWQLERGYKPE